MMFENQYRTHTCAGIDESVIGSEVRVAGWVENIRDHEIGRASCRERV